MLCRALDIQRRIGVPSKQIKANIAAVKKRVPGGGC